MIRSSKYSLVLKTGILFCAVLAVWLRCGAPGVSFSFAPLRMYGVLGGLMAALYYLLAVLTFAGKGNAVWCPSLKFTVLISEILIWAVVQFMIPGQFAGASGTTLLTQRLLHTVIPLLMLLDWLLFDAHGILRLYDPLLALIPPAGYALVILFGGVIGWHVPSPYWFMNTANLGTPTALLIVLGLGGGIIGTGYLFYFADRLLSQVTRNRKRG